MNTYYTFIFFAFILLFSNSPLAYQIYKYPYESYQENIPVSKMMMVIPTEVDATDSQYILPPLYRVLDREYMISSKSVQKRPRRGWGSGRRRRSFTYN